jgi:hypothetical protein
MKWPMEKCLTPLAIKEIQIKMTLKFYFTHVGIAIISSTHTKTNVDEDASGGERNP